MENTDIKTQAAQELANVKTRQDLQAFEARFLGRKGLITLGLKGLKKLPPEQRKQQAMTLNSLRKELQAAIPAREAEVIRMEANALAANERFDISLPGMSNHAGHPHPLTLVQEEITDVFERMGFYVLDYPEAETDFFNFEALNIPKDHPARDMQDTFFLEDGNVLRTHTSAGQVRAMKELKPPFSAIFPGRVYRYEATDASHDHTFDQVEGLMLDHKISVANMMYYMEVLLEAVLKHKTVVRLRPGFFPFVEPGFELDIQCQVCGGKGCPVCKQSGWVELMPCGLVHPNVIRAGGLDPDQWQGWAFGLGMSRMVMMRYEIDDIRHLLGGDLRFIEQFYPDVQSKLMTEVVEGGSGARR